MQEILTIMAAEGMVLAKDVVTGEGRVLCGKGTTLSAPLLERLKKMEVSHIVVEGHPVALNSEKSLEEELQALHERFSRVGDIPPLVYLRERIRARLIASRGK